MLFFLSSYNSLTNPMRRVARGNERLCREVVFLGRTWRTVEQLYSCTDVFWYIHLSLFSIYFLSILLYYIYNIYYK